jgi:hypothetical protein
MYGSSAYARRISTLASSGTVGGQIADRESRHPRRLRWPLPARRPRHAAAAAGVPERAIMAQTGHRSLATLRKYVREGSLFLENAAAKAGL